MYEWRKQIQTIVDEIDKCIKKYNGEALTLRVPKAGLFRILHNKEIQRNIRYVFQGLSEAQKAGFCA